MQKNISTMACPWTPSEKASLAIVIGRVFDLQKQYGKTTDQLENIVAGFCWALAAYPVELVVEGFKQYITIKSDLPTPADIRQIIDPIPPQWVPDKPYYISLKKIFAEQGPFGLADDEMEYIKKYEEYMLHAQKTSR